MLSGWREAEGRGQLVHYRGTADGLFPKKPLDIGAVDNFLNH